MVDVPSSSVWVMRGKKRDAIIGDVMGGSKGEETDF